MPADPSARAPHPPAHLPHCGEREGCGSRGRGTRGRGQPPSTHQHQRVRPAAGRGSQTLHPNPEPNLEPEQVTQVTKRKPGELWKVTNSLNRGQRDMKATRV